MMRENATDAGSRQGEAEGWLNSSLALAGLCFGIGVLEPEEVLRYMDASFRYNAPTPGPHEDPNN